MKKLIIILMLLSLCAPATIEAKPKKMGQQSYLPFAQKGKYGKLPTKKAKRNNRAESWIYRQWGR